MKEEIIREIVDRFKRNFGANKKLGEMYSWSLPAKNTCPGKTRHCAALCYVKQYTDRWPNTLTSYNRSQQISKFKSFREIMAAALGRLNEGILRLHVSGDFYSARYTRDWFEILNANPHIKPFAFTRSWRVPEILDVFREYGSPPWLFASSDIETGPVPYDLREAKMTEDPLFQMRKGFIPAPRLICDEQINPANVTCSSCGRCPTFKLKDRQIVALPKAVIRNGVVFAQH